MTRAEFLALYIENDEESPVGFSCVSDGEWIVDGKYSTKEDVYYSPEHNQYFCIILARSGSYHTDYDYDDPLCAEVYPKEVTKIEYHIK